MDYNIVTLEITNLLIQFDYFQQLTKDESEDIAKVTRKWREHISAFFDGKELNNGEYLRTPVSEWKDLVYARLSGSKSKDIHELVEKLEKDVKKIKKIYKAAQ